MLVIMVILGWVSGFGFGWINMLGIVNVVCSWMLLLILLVLGIGYVGILLGLGDYIIVVLLFICVIGVLIIMVMVCWLLLVVFCGWLYLIGGLGVVLVVIVLLFFVV